MQEVDDVTKSRPDSSTVKSSRACEFNFKAEYGDEGAGYIEAHHRIPFAELNGDESRLDPATDFAVLCANCHRMVHRAKYTVEELRETIAKTKVEIG